jgi:adenylate kinase family enzyme
MALVILIGASGAGKTTIAEAIAQRHGDEVAVFHFDQIGVPSVERMVAECGSK